MIKVEKNASKHQVNNAETNMNESEMKNKELKWIDKKKIEEAKEHHLDEDALIPHAPSRACRPWIFFIN